MLRIGIFFGGPAREREISFLGSKTTFAGLDQALFTPVPVFIDGRGNFILLDTKFMEAASLRDFYPPKSFLSEGKYPFRVYEESLNLTPEAEKAMIAEVGTRVYPHELKQYVDFAFLIVHGPQLEDGAIQGLLEWYGIPYYGSGLMGSGIGIDKIAQNELLQCTVGLKKRIYSLSKEQWDKTDKGVLFEEVKAQVGIPFVCKAPHQGSSIGVTFVRKDELEEFERSVRQSFFQLQITKAEWAAYNDEEKGKRLQRIANLDEGIAFPVVFNEGELIYHPQELWEKLDTYFTQTEQAAPLSSIHAEDAVLFESFVNGQEFSCGVIQDLDGNPLALPPSEVIKEDDTTVFDFETKYLKNTTRKSIPIRTSLENNQKVHAQVKEVFHLFRFGACVRIDGFLTPEGDVILHDPNTLPGMSPASFIFKQMAEIGFNITDSLTYFIRFSLRERIRTGKFTAVFRLLLAELDRSIEQKNLRVKEKQEILFEPTEAAFDAVKKQYNNLTSSATIQPVPVLNHPEEGKYTLDATHMAKATIPDLLSALHEPVHPLIEECRQNAKQVTAFITGII
ncbi:MAG: D-alanine--D-alanine ligase [Siphonobacter sp.]